MQLILASTSPYRRMLLERLGLPFEAVAPPFPEHGQVEIPDPSALVLANALGKARSLRAQYPRATIIGSDQAAVCNGRVLGKPGTAERAVQQLMELAGHEHTLLTAVSVITPGTPPGGRELSELVTNRIRVRPLDEDEARAYVARERPIDCAGAYKSEALGIALFEHLRGDDPTAIVGLPLISLCNLLREVGIDPLLHGPAHADPDPQRTE